MGTTDTASLNTKLPADEKQLFTETAESLGMTPSAVIRVFVRKFNEYQGFPFALRKTIPMSEAERTEIEMLDKAIDTGTAKTYGSFSELLAEVDAEISEENKLAHA
jgi:addiction module RelB/DinJ family antitoxin